MRIGILDSGIGGLTLLGRLVDKIPYNQYIYYADNRYSPYGSLNYDFLAKRVSSVCDELIADGAEILALGCNTAGSNFLDLLRQTKDVPIVAVLPEAYPERERTLVMCTPLTARSPIVKCYVERGAAVYADPKLVPLIEAHRFDLTPVYDYVLPKIKEYRPSSVTLGCTHYVYLRSAIEDALGVTCRDGMDSVAEEVATRAAGSHSSDSVISLIFSGEDESEAYLRLLAGR